MTQAIQTAPLGHYRVKHVVRSEVAKIADPAIDRYHSRRHRRRRPVGDRAGNQRRLAPRSGVLQRLRPHPGSP